jgi:type II secretory pathway component PulF
MAPLSMARLDPEEFLVSPAADGFTQFNRNLAEMTSVGIPLPRAIREIAAGLRRGRFRRGLERIDAALRDGKTLDAAVGEVEGLFPPYYRWILKAGAASGNLPAVLSAVARNTEGIRLARRTLVEALLYPFLIVLTAVLVSAATLVILVPFYREISEVQGFQPKGLEFILKAFDSLGTAAALSTGALALAIAAVWMLGRTVAGERIFRRLPIIGRVYRHLMMARLLGSLGVMLRANVPLPQALPVALSASGSLELARRLDHLTGAATEGRGLGEVLKGAPGFSDVASYLAVAERTGEAPQAAGATADLLTEQAISDTETLFVVLVPAALLVAGVLVGGLLVSVILPYLQLLESFRR